MNSPVDQSPALRHLASSRAILRSYSAIAIGAVLFSLGLALRLYRLGAQSLWLDEGGTWAEVTGQTWGKLLADLWSPYAAYPLYHLLLKGWIALAGDSEWALRLPSALAGAAAVVVIFFAGCELENDERQTFGGQAFRAALPRRRSAFAMRPLIAALLFAISPFALWQAQDAKVYSLLLLCAALLLWALLHALRAGTSRAWLALLAIMFVSVFVHRLAVLGCAGALIAVALVWPFDRRGIAVDRQSLAARMRSQFARGALLLAALLAALAAIYGVVRAVGVESRGGSGHIPAGPIGGLWLSLSHFALDRGNIGGWLGLPLLVWALPALALTLWGLALLARDAWRGQPSAIAILCLFAAPLLLFASALVFVRQFESRYMTVAFPAWLFVLAYPLRTPQRVERELGRWVGQAFEQQTTGFSIFHASFFILAGALLLIDLAVLFQPAHGLFSGAPVKEQWRAGVAEIARRAQPDDLLILHPYYVQPMWAYYAPRVTPDPLPQVVTFNVLGQGACREQAKQDPSKLPLECYRREYEKGFNDVARGHKRMLMLLAPEHARTIDPPKTLEELARDAQASGAQAPAQADSYGFLGLRFQYAADQRTWPCGGTGDALIGVEVMCASFPSFYGQSGPASIPQPQIKLPAVFGGELGLRGYTIAPAGGQLRPGGTLPITLYWAAVVDHPTHDYTMFLHLCHDCDQPPLAQDDRPPLDGHYPAGQTTTWRLGGPVHDERAIPLIGPNGQPLAAGRYTLLLGVYPSGLPDPKPPDRLPVSSVSAEVRGDTRLVLGEVVVGP